MRISRHWLKNYADIPDAISAEKFAELLTLHTVEIEGFEKLGDRFGNVVVGQIKKIQKHPQADKLSVCQVDVGENRILNIICGAVNIYEGMYVAVALPGAKVRWHGEGDFTELKPAKIRGVDSEGMICAAEELGLQDLLPQADGVIDLGIFCRDAKSLVSALRAGQSLAALLELDDHLYEVDGKSITHRPDMWGHYGLGRDTAAFLKLDFKEENLPPLQAGAERQIAVKIQKKALCSRYMTLIMDNIKVGPSPYWLKKALFSIGQKSINNIVDLTNYVMWDVGHPLHGYDADLANTSEIHVRYARKGEKLATLDGKERELGSQMVVVGTSDRPLLLGGIMGGLSTAIHDKTNRIIVEAGTFDPVITRKTGLALGLRTEACIMYEKTLDPETGERALKKFVSLARKVIPSARVASNIADIYQKHYKVKPIRLSSKFLTQKIGAALKKEDIFDVLKRLGFGISEKKSQWMVSVPSWRATKDITLPEDLVEEISRIYGYDNIPIQTPCAPVAPPRTDKKRLVIRKSKSIFAALGYQEVFNYSFVGEKLLNNLMVNSEGHLALKNPIAPEYAFVRRNLAGGLLNSAAANQERLEGLLFFEVGKAVIPEKSGEKGNQEGTNRLPSQPDILGMVYANRKDTMPFYGLKAAVVEYLKAIHLEAVSFRTAESFAAWLHPERAAGIYLGEENIGYLGEVHPVVMKNFDIMGRAALCEIDLTRIVEASLRYNIFKEVNRYPAVERDIAIIVGKSLKWESVLEVIYAAGGALVQTVELFDVYHDGKVDSDKKSLAFHVVFQAPDRTLEVEEVEKIQEKIMKSLEEKLGAVLRQ